MYEDTDRELSSTIRTLAGGEPYERPKGAPTPCHMCPKVPVSKQHGKATRADAIEPTERSWEAYAHYQRCKAVGRFPADPLVESNAGLIAGIEESIERARLQQTAGLLNLLVSSGGRS